MTKFTPEERAFMVEFVPGHSHAEIRAEFHRRFGHIPSKSFPGDYIKNHKLSTGRTGRFEKGHKPANKGKPMSKEQYDKLKGTFFKTGVPPHNADPVGTEKMLSDGYTWVKVSNKPKVKKSENWVQKHRLIYEEAHGKIPDGHFVTFLDGDRTNFDLNNLALVSKAEHCTLNRQDLRYADADCTRVGLTIAKIMIATKKRG